MTDFWRLLIGYSSDTIRSHFQVTLFPYWVLSLHIGYVPYPVHSKIVKRYRWSTASSLWLHLLLLYASNLFPIRSSCNTVERIKKKSKVIILEISPGQVSPQQWIISSRMRMPLSVKWNNEVGQRVYLDICKCEKCPITQILFRIKMANKDSITMMIRSIDCPRISNTRLGTPKDVHV